MKKFYKILSFVCVLCLVVSTAAFTGCGKQEQPTGGSTAVSGEVELSAESENSTDDTLSAESETSAEPEAGTAETEDAGESADNKAAQTNKTDNQSNTSSNKNSSASSSSNSGNSSSSSSSNNASSSNSSSSSNTGSTSTEAPKMEELAAPSYKTGTYSGGHTTYSDGMAQDIAYSYSITLNGDGTYKYAVNFSVKMGEETYPQSQSESGTYSVNGSSITFKSSSGSTTSGTISGNTISATRYVSTQAPDAVTIKVRQ